MLRVCGLTVKGDLNLNRLIKQFCSSIIIALYILYIGFLQGIGIACYAESCISYGRVVRLSVVCPSVTRWHCVKTTQARVAKSSRTDSPRTLDLAIKNSSRNSIGFTPSEGVK